MKLEYIQKLNSKFDALKFFLKILWEIKGISNQKYADLSQLLASIGKMIGGWQNYFKF
ncbi:MAG: four helix bundle protein [bacterium]